MPLAGKDVFDFIIGAIITRNHYGAILCLFSLGTKAVNK